MKKHVAIVLFLVLLSVSFVGCAPLAETIEQTTQWRDRAHEAKSTAQTRLDELAEQREQFPDGSAQAELIDGAIARARAKISMLEAAIMHADMVLEEAQHPSDALTQITGKVVPFVPAPVQAPLLLGAALLTTLVRSRQLRSGADSIIKSIQHAAGNDESFRIALASNADTIRTIQTPLARRMVDRVQRS
jgi:hypothetical protein